MGGMLVPSPMTTDRRKRHVSAPSASNDGSAPLPGALTARDPAVKRLLTVALVFEVPPAIGFLLFPGATLQTIAGVTLDASGVPVARVLGAALLGFCVLLWRARKSDSAEFVRGAVTCMFVYYAVSAVVLMLAQLSGQMGPMGWGMVLAHSALAVWCGYALLKR